MRPGPEPARSADRRLSRRQLLQAGGVAALGLTLPELLRARAPAGPGGGRGPERSCIFIVQYGGASHLDSLDLKHMEQLKEGE